MKTAPVIDSRPAHHPLTLDLVYHSCPLLISHGYFHARHFQQINEFTSRTFEMSSRTSPAADGILRAA